MQSKSELIANYYDSCEGDYRTFWNLDQSLAMHAGYWDGSIKTLADALERENVLLADLVRIKRSDKVLDAGCGVGGSSIFLAGRYGCQVTGITLSEKQVESACRYAKQKGVDRLVNFEQMDFCHTCFSDATFDVVWGLESVCHAQDKAQFVREAYRILKPGGRLVVGDGFAKQSSYNQKQSGHMRRWLSGWGVDTLDTVHEFKAHLSAAGFRDVGYEDITSNVMPSSKRLYWISLPAWVYSKVGEWFGKRTKVQTENILAARYQYVTLKQGLWEYGVFKALKK